MRKFWMLAGVFVALFGGIDTNAAQAEDSVEVEQEQAVVHYEAIEIESAAHALKILDKGTAEIAEILKQDGELEFTDLESIHEITYTLEASVDKIRDEKAAEDAKIDLLDEAVQAIHFASENQKEAEVRSWFAKLETAAGEVKTKIVDITPVKREFYSPEERNI